MDTHSPLRNRILYTPEPFLKLYTDANTAREVSRAERYAFAPKEKIIISSRRKGKMPPGGSTVATPSTHNHRNVQRGKVVDIIV